MVICYLGIGSNLGNRQRNINQAVKKISALKDTKIMKKSRVYSFPPLGGPKAQPDYLNSALKILTGLSPLILLKELKKIEKEIGRKKSVRFGPRVIDLDILLYGNRIIRSRDLTVPHPRMFDREFVYKPLSEIL